MAHFHQPSEANVHQMILHQLIERDAENPSNNLGIMHNFRFNCALLNIRLAFFFWSMKLYQKPIKFISDLCRKIATEKKSF